MTTDVLEAEATGEQFFVATFRKHEYKLPTDADDWPLSLIAVSVGVRDDKLIVDHTALVHALSALLGAQWRDFVRAHPKRRDLVPASRSFAAAAGFDAQHGDLAFGALPRLLDTLTRYSAAVEATLAEMRVDYRDRFRFDDADHRRLLTLRQINNRLSHARHDSALAIALNENIVPLTATDLLLMDVFEAITRHLHPSRPATPAQKAARAADKSKLEAAAADWRKRHPTSATRKQRAVETARANAQQKETT